MNMEQLYVSATRAKEEVRLYTDNKDDIRDAVKRSSQKWAALDIRPTRPKIEGGCASGDRLRKHMKRRKRLSLIHCMRTAWDKIWPGKERQVQQAETKGRWTMATDDEKLRRVPLRPKVSSLLPPSGKAPAKPAEASDASITETTAGDYDTLPLPGSAYTEAYSRPTNKPEITLHVLLRDGSYRGFAWSNFDSVDMLPGDKAGSGRVIILRFAGMVPTELRLTGWNLGYLYTCLGRQSPRVDTRTAIETRFR